MAYESYVNGNINCGNFLCALPGGIMNITFGQGAEDIRNARTSDSEKEQSDDEFLASTSEEKCTCMETRQNMKQGLKEIADLQLANGGTSAFETLVYVLEKYVQLEDETGYMETRNKTDQLIIGLPSIVAAFALAAQYIKLEQEFEMILICKYVVTWYRHHAMTGGDAKQCIDRINECIYGAGNAAIIILNNPGKKIYQPYLIPLMWEMFFDLKDIRVDAKYKMFKVGMETLASHRIATVLYSLQEWEETFSVCDGAIAEMQRVCGKNAKKFVSYGDVLFLAATAKFQLEDLKGAKKLLFEAKEVFQMEDGNDVNQDKGRNLRWTEEWIKLVRKTLKDRKVTKSK